MGQFGNVEGVSWCVWETLLTTDLAMGVVLSNLVTFPPVIVFLVPVNVGWSSDRLLVVAFWSGSEASHWGHSVHVKLDLSSWSVVGKIDGGFLLRCTRRRRWRSNGDPCRRWWGLFSVFHCRIEAGDKVLVSRIQIGPIARRSDSNEAQLV